jgi:acetyltransferase
MLSDELARQGMELPPLTEPTRAELAKILPPESSIQNPIDALPSRTADQIKAIIRILGAREGGRIDVIAFLVGDSRLSDNAGIYREISTAMQSSPIPIVPMLSSVISSRSKIAAFVGQGNVYFPDEVELGQALGAVANWAAPQEASAIPDGYDRDAVEAALGNHGGALAPEIAARVLGAAGFRLPVQLEVLEEGQLTKNCRRVGYPLAMKVTGPLHKTDVGGVKLNINDDAEALAAWKDLLAIPHAQGVLLQPMIGGLEVILGASREGDFGHLVMFGLGGIYAEALKDVKFALAPLSRDESLRMIRDLQSYSVLKGLRGEAGMDIDALAVYIERIGRLVSDFPRIKEIDLNPIKGVDSDLYAVDARIIVDL